MGPGKPVVSALLGYQPGKAHAANTDFLNDEVYAFFQNCYHLKDWLKNDSSSASKVKDVETFVGSSTPLTICADLANGSKHLLLKRPRGDASTTVGARHFNVTISDSISGGSTPTTISIRYEVHANRQVYDAYTIATDCLGEWEAYLNRQGLLP
jgi:hypothetical protein